MKLTCAFLIVTLASVSNQQNFNRAPLPYAHHRARSHFVPLFYANGIPAGYDLIDTNQAQQVLPRNGNNDAGRLFNNLITVTSTAAAVTSTVVTPAFASCIPVAQFAANATTACARRRREVQADHIQPVAPLPLEASVISDSQPAAPPQLELLSSKSDELAADQSPNGLEERRLTTVKYVTPTSYKFVATTITATKTLAAAGGLSCLPAGYAVC